MTHDWLLLAARVLLCSTFLLSAYDKIRLLPNEVGAIESLHLPAPAFLCRLAGACQVVGCIMLVLGPGTRTAAVLLALFVASVTVAFLRFWSIRGDPAARAGQRNTFFTNFSVIGGLLYVAALGPGALVAFDPGW